MADNLHTASHRNVCWWGFSVYIQCLNRFWNVYIQHVGRQTLLCLCLPLSKTICGGVRKSGPRIGNIIVKQSCLYLLHLWRYGQFSLHETAEGDQRTDTNTITHIHYTRKLSPLTPDPVLWVSVLFRWRACSYAHTPGSTLECKESVRPSWTWCLTCYTPRVISPGCHPGWSSPETPQTV